MLAVPSGVNGWMKRANRSPLRARLQHWCKIKVRDAAGPAIATHPKHEEQHQTYRDAVIPETADGFVGIAAI